MSNIKTYTAENIEVQYDSQRCIHAAECVKRLRTVFDTAKRPWIQPSNAPAAEVAATIEQCPSGALHYRYTDGSAGEALPAENVVRIQAHGPNYVQGDLLLNLPDGSTQSETRLALCRCGASKNKPFCDNSHFDIDFKAGAELAANQAKSDPTLIPSGQVVITPTPNGSVKLEGAVTITNAAGETVKTAKTWLCRCGHSANKPFCDGTHKTVNFEAP
jgi:CDGSH-type Zn-finger protein/uncharacterized Fe-S cluster protein YjdI